MSKIRVLSDHVANQIAAGEVVERPASVAKELVENSIDAGARRIEIDVEAGGRRLLRIADDGEGMGRDDAVLAFERHATSKITSTEDLTGIRTLGFRGEALASIASIARLELLTQTAGETSATRVLLEGGRIRDVQPAAHPRGTTITVRDLFFNVPARRKFLRSEATESFHLTNLVTHYALAHPEIAFVLTNNGRETLRAGRAADLRERAYQIFGAEFLDNLLEVSGGHEARAARVRGYISAPRERRSSRDAQYLFVNGRFVRDRLIGRALSEGYRSVLPPGAYPAALLFLDVPLEEVDVNVHPAKTEVRFRRAAAVADTVREAVRAALASNGYVRVTASSDQDGPEELRDAVSPEELAGNSRSISSDTQPNDTNLADEAHPPGQSIIATYRNERGGEPQQEAIEFAPTIQDETRGLADDRSSPPSSFDSNAAAESAAPRTGAAPLNEDSNILDKPQKEGSPHAHHVAERGREEGKSSAARPPVGSGSVLPPLMSAIGLVREAPVETLSANIRPLGQLEDSFIIATDAEGLLLIDQHVAHERILFDKYRALEATRPAESQNLLVPDTFDLTPAQAAAFDGVAEDLESYGFGLMRLSGRTIAIKAVPADLPVGEARQMLAEILDTVEAERRGGIRATLRDVIAARLACRAAIKTSSPLAPEKMRWLIDKLLTTSSPTTCPHGRPVILRLATRDIEKGFHRS